jgi:hypothetical protein
MTTGSSLSRTASRIRARDFRTFDASMVFMSTRGGESYESARSKGPSSPDPRPATLGPSRGYALDGMIHASRCRSLRAYSRATKRRLNAAQNNARSIDYHGDFHLVAECLNIPAQCGNQVITTPFDTRELRLGERRSTCNVVLCLADASTQRPQAHYQRLVLLEQDPFRYRRPRQPTSSARALSSEDDSTGEIGWGAVAMRPGPGKDS